MMNIKIEKRDKEIEDYDPEKIKAVVIATGLSEREAGELVEKVDAWVRKAGKDILSSLQIRDRVLVEIQKINEYAAKKFIWYEKYKDKNFGVKY